MQIIDLSDYVPWSRDELANHAFYESVVQMLCCNTGLRSFNFMQSSMCDESLCVQLLRGNHTLRELALNIPEKATLLFD